jgi:hypothetical protein
MNSADGSMKPPRSSLDARHNGVQALKRIVSRLWS